MSNIHAPGVADTPGGMLSARAGKRSHHSKVVHCGCRKLRWQKRQIDTIQIYLQKHFERWSREPVQPLTPCSLHTASSVLSRVPWRFQNDPGPPWTKGCGFFLFGTWLVIFPTLTSLSCPSSAQSKLYLQFFAWNVVKALAQVKRQCAIEDFSTNCFKKKSEHALMYACAHTHTSRYTFI